MRQLAGMALTGAFFLVASAIGLGIGATYFSARLPAQPSNAPRVLHAQAVDGDSFDLPVEEELPPARERGVTRVAQGSPRLLLPQVAAATVGADASVTITVVVKNVNGVVVSQNSDGSYTVPDSGASVECEVTVTNAKENDVVTLDIRPMDGLSLPAPQGLPTRTPESRTITKSDGTSVTAKSSFTFTKFKRTGEYTLTGTLTRGNLPPIASAMNKFKLAPTATQGQKIKITQVVQKLGTANYSSARNELLNRETWLLDQSGAPAALTLKADFEVAIEHLYLIGAAKAVNDADKQQSDPISMQPGSKSLEFFVKPPLESGRRLLSIYDMWEQRPSDERWTVHVPTAKRQDLAQPVIKGTANGKYSEFASVSGAVNVYGSYLRLKGVNHPGNGTLKIVVYVQANATDTTQFEFLKLIENDQVEMTDNGAWTVTSTLPEFADGVKAKLFVLAYDRDKDVHSVSDPLELNCKSNQKSDLGVPILASITPISANSAATKSAEAKAYMINDGDFAVGGDKDQVLPESSQLLLYDVTEGKNVLIGRTAASEKPLKVVVKGMVPGRLTIQAAFARGDLEGDRSEPVDVIINPQGPRVTAIAPPNFGTAPGITKLRIEFDPKNQLEPNSAGHAGNYVLYGSNGTGLFDRGSETVVKSATPAFDPQTNSVLLSFPANTIGPDVYKLVVTGRPPSASAQDKDKSGIRDMFGNYLEGIVGKRGTDFSQVLTKPAGPNDKESGYFVIPEREKSPFVVYPEYTNPRTTPEGFNPSDRVETRVSRLYYNRDAPRVAQIINRDLRSYNRAGVEMQKQLADKARREADAATDERRQFERKAVQAAQEARQAEHQLKEEQAALAAARQKDAEAAAEVADTQAQLKQARATKANPDAPADDPTNPSQIQAKTTQLSSELDAAQRIRLATTAEVKAATDRVTAAQTTLQAKRADEVKANEESLQKTAKEERAKEDQFRREVAAAHEDPDNFAPGKPDSSDPVQQVSVSVVGEGMLQLRGPLKGIQIVRLMINELDQPIGQIRVAVHTMQVNGEHGDRMETAVARIQKYVDHSRFLTMQSAEMLRQAVVEVASRRAEECGITGSGSHQDERDQKYVEAFFGHDFIAELKAIDSEFLRSGNKLLSLHSMDTTSLSSALFLMALAKNSTRQEILAEFQRLVQCDLPQQECDYFQASGGKKAYGCGKFKLFSTNARFSSLMGQFKNRVSNDDTLTPVQREFIRLAQIFKSRLVTEMELKQRVMERALIEQRFQRGAKEEAEDANRLENEAKVKLQQVRDQSRKSQSEFLKAFQPIQAEIAKLNKSLNDANSSKAVVESYIKGINNKSNIKSTRTDLSGFAAFVVYNVDYSGECRLGSGDNEITVVFDEEHKASIEDEGDKEKWSGAIRTLEAIGQQLRQFNFVDHRKSDFRKSEEFLDNLQRDLKTDPSAKMPFSYNSAAQVISRYSGLLDHVLVGLGEYRTLANAVVLALKNPDDNFTNVSQSWDALRQAILDDTQGNLGARAKVLLARAQQSLDELETSLAEQRVAKQQASESRRPLDHKKFLDMLIDEKEEKYIELLEGTRAHTANIDNYIKRLTTALDDDLNTQFYHPAFREVREAGRTYDVNLSQIETTSILTNNRAFAKVSPQATMEFDLPKRDILINEAFKSTKALYDDYGALLQDPTFLSLSKLNSGQPTSSPVGGAGGSSPVRDVLPGLPSQTNEKVLGQPGPGNKQFGSALEALIPDPAIYKFETGTGYEIRPVVQPDGQAVVFHFNYMYTTNIREPVRADEKHLGRVKRHFIDTDVQLSNFELREVSRYQVALKASRTARGVPLLEDVPGLGILFRPLPQAESSLQQNLILSQATIFPTLFDLMGLRWAPAIADLDPLHLWNDDFIVRSRKRDLSNRVYDISSGKVDEFMRTPLGERRTDLYRSQETIPGVHPNGYRGRGVNLRDSRMQEGYNPGEAYPDTQFVPENDSEGAAPANGPRGPRLAPDGIDEIGEPLSQRRRRTRRAPVIQTKAEDPVRPAATGAAAPRQLRPEAVQGSRPVGEPAGTARMRDRVAPAEVNLPEQKPQPKGLKIFSPFRKKKGS
ncbi:MAG: hypothetical protein ACKV0T_22225 [Planctomycetales bacterium]